MKKHLLASVAALLASTGLAFSQAPAPAAPSEVIGWPAGVAGCPAEAPAESCAGAARGRRITLPNRAPKHSDVVPRRTGRTTVVVAGNGGSESFSASR